VIAVRVDTGTGWPEQEPPRPPRAAPDAGAEPDAGAAPGAPAQPEPRAQRDLSARPGRRFSAAGAVIGLLLGLLGFALVVQLKAKSADPELSAARPEDLVRILSDLEAREERLRQEIASLQETERQLASGAQGSQAALEEARRRADELGILAGTLPAEGTGLEVLFAPQSKPIRAQAILDAVEELRGAGAEAIQLSGADGAAVRVVASTAFVDDGDGLLSGGRHLVAPFTITVIGDPQTLRTALNIPGGVVETVGRDGGTVTMREPAGGVRITALHQQGPLRYAEPTS
jgi:uncharacterized protein YlxW (UPF0749 family)